MAKLRPAVSPDDSYIEKIIKYIPVEIITAYTTLVGYLHVENGNSIPNHYSTYYLIMLIILLLITPVWTYFAVVDTQKEEPLNKVAVFQSIVAVVAFLVWVYATGNEILKYIICHTGECAGYSSILEIGRAHV